MVKYYEGGFVYYSVFIIAGIITGITSLIPNPYLPMLFPMINVIGMEGVVAYGFVFPFCAGRGIFNSYDYIGFLVDYAIFCVIVYLIINRVADKKYIKQHRFRRKH